MPLPIPDPAPVPSVPVAGHRTPFPVRRILCIGRNYAAHAREMGASDREPPFFFAKSPDALCVAAGPTRWPLPPRSADVHHELEHVVALGAGGRDLDPSTAAALVCAEGLGLDMTRRDVQAAAKAQGRPWTTGKDFDGSAIVGELVAVGADGPRAAGRLLLTIDGVVRQEGDLADRIWDVGELIAELSTWMTLRAGDLLFTGTPAGVGPVHAGAHLVGTLDGLPSLDLTVTARP